MEVMGRDRYLHGKDSFSIFSPSFHFLYSSPSFSPHFLSFFLFVFFFSSFHIFLLFFFFLYIVNFREEKDNF